MRPPAKNNGQRWQDTKKCKVKSEKLRIGIVGFGTIGKVLAEAIKTRFKDKANLVAVYDIEKSKVKGQKSKVDTIDEVIEKSDLIIESASVNISAAVTEKTINRCKDVLVMSTGGLLGRRELFAQARKNNCRIFIPSGALAGLDGIKAARFGRIDRITLTTKKPPLAFGLDSIDKETVLFEGGVAGAIKRFPQNINVSATLSILSGSAKKVSVRILTSPEYKVNTHELEIEGDFGRLITRAENIPSKTNPKTSRLAIISAIAILDEILDIKIR